MTKTFEEVISGIRKAKKGVEVREDLAQMGEYCKQFTDKAGQKADSARDEAKGYAAAAKASEKKATDAVAGIEQTKTDAVQAVQNAQTTATTAVQQAQSTATTAVTAKQTEAVQAVDDERDSALQQVADSTRAAQTAASNAAASEQAAQASKEAAATSAGAAESSATAASGSASAAATSESNAASSAENSEASAARSEAAAKKAEAVVSTDKTFTVPGAPADAAATGEALGKKADKDVILDPDGNVLFYSKSKVDELLAGKLGLHDTADNSNKLNGYELRLSDHPNSINVLVQTVDEDGSTHIDTRRDSSVGLTAIVASGPNYIRFADGTQICFGASFNGQIPEVVTYPVPFIDTPFTAAVRHWSGPTGAADTEVWILETTNTGFKIGSNQGIYAHWISAGRWK